MKTDLNYSYIKLDLNEESVNARKHFLDVCYFKSACRCYHEQYRKHSIYDTDLGNKKLFIEISKPIVKLRLK